MNINKLKIGEFSRLCKVTVKTLRHYEKIGLLVPEIVDIWTGYRYYTVAQLQKMQSIIQLKSLGFRLEEIQNLWDEDGHSPSLSMLEDKIRDCEEELERLRARHEKLEALISSHKKIQKMEKIFIDSLEAICAASYRTTIDAYEDLGRLCYEVIGPEMAAAGCECTEPGYCFSIEHGGYREKDIDIEYFEQVKEKKADRGKLKFVDLPAVPKAVCMKVYGPYEGLHQSYIDLFAWIEENGYKICGAPRANYVDGAWNQEDPQRWLTVIQIPVEE